MKRWIGQPAADTALPGLTFRPLRDVEDTARIVAIDARSAARDRVDPLSTLEDVPTLDEERDVVRQALGRREQEDWLLVEVEDEPVGYGRVLWWVERDGTRVYLHLGKVVPAWRRRGIGTAILGWAEARARQLAAALPAAGRHELAVNASETEVEATALLRDAGYRVPFTMLEMGLELAEHLAEPPLPSGVAVRPALPADYRAISSSVDEAYRASRGDGRFSMATDLEEYARFLAGRHPALWQVAWEGQEVAGQVLCRVERRRAEVFEVSVRPGWRRRGLGRALLVRALNVLKDRGVGAARLHVREDNPDRAFILYENVGFHRLKHFPRYRKATVD